MYIMLLNYNAHILLLARGPMGSILCFKIYISGKGETKEIFSLCRP